MKKMFVVTMAALFTLGFAGLSFSEGMAGMHHATNADQKTCGVPNCCAQHQKSPTKDTQSKNQGGDVSWSGIATLQPSQD